MIVIVRTGGQLTEPLLTSMTVALHRAPLQETLGLQFVHADATVLYTSRQLRALLGVRDFEAGQARLPPLYHLFSINILPLDASYWLLLVATYPSLLSIVDGCNGKRCPSGTQLHYSRCYLTAPQQTYSLFYVPYILNPEY